MSGPVLELVQVSIPFGGEGARIDPAADAPDGLRDVSLELHPGERFALLGTSGAGKSSLLKAIAEPHAGVRGTIRVAGRDARTTPPRAREALLLDQRPLLFPHLKVRGNVAFPLEIRGVRGERLDSEISRALRAVRMEELAHRPPGSLSGGQAHRVALARAIAADPALLLLDEPFTGLDPELRTTLQETVVRVASERGIATLTVTHDPAEAGRIADRIGVLVGGRLARIAPPAELFLDPGSGAVARLLGWPNRIQLRTPDGPGELVFPPEGARLVARSGGELPVEIVRVTRSPSGAVAHWVLDPRRPVTALEIDAPDEVAGEVAVDPLDPPEPGARAGLELIMSRCRSYPLAR